MKATPEQADRLHAFAHDLRNRLIGLHQTLDHLKGADPEAENAELFTHGEQQFFKALREVERLLDDMEVERGTTSLVLSDLPLATLLGQRTDLMGFRFERKQQTVALDLGATPTIRADERILGDLIDALLSNASKFSHPGTTVHVSTSMNGRDVLLTIRDEGTGLSTEDVEQTFTRFAWLSSRPTSGEAQGRSTLARARQWARVHGGELSVHSPGVGLGCTFTLRLPVVAQASE